MSDIAISVENLSKKYHIGRAQQRHDTLRDALVAGAKAPFERLRRGGRSSYDEEDTIWALKDVSFEVKRGEVVGVIGRNGAGKSTLLKILTQITEPTSGRAVLNGRVGSLLEVGTGFHQELTGRENIYLSGAILGMRQVEIDRKFDEIVDFSGVEKFIDTPVKRYSSGMRVRLGFAVAAHLDPEILLIDEVLAVGDVAFQKKCLGKMQGVAGKGRTVVFVSHNMAAVEHLCSEAYLLTDGAITARGNTHSVISAYLGDSKANGSKPFEIRQAVLSEAAKTVDHGFKIIGIELLNQDGHDLSELTTGDSLILRIHYLSRENYIAPSFMVSIANNYGVELIRVSTMPISGYFIEKLYGKGYIDLTIEDFPLTGGNYHCTIGVARANVEWLLKLESVLVLHVDERDVYNSGHAIDNRKGVVTLKHQWHLSEGNT